MFWKVQDDLNLYRMAYDNYSVLLSPVFPRAIDQRLLDTNIFSLLVLLMWFPNS